LLTSTVPKAKSGDRIKGISDDHSDLKVMHDLVCVFSGTDTIFCDAPKDTSKYKECLSEGSINVPFNDNALIATFDTSVRDEYSDALNRMLEFINKHINMKTVDWLVRALIEIIESDKLIEDSDEFYINRDGTPCTKKEIKERIKFDFGPFLLGVFHYVVTKRRDQNVNGQLTLDVLGEKKNRKPRKCSSNVGKSVKRDITVNTTIDNSTYRVDEFRPDESEGRKPEETAKVLDDRQPSDVDSEDIKKTTAIYQHIEFTETELESNDTILLQKFRKDCKPILIYIIDNDPSGSPTKVTLADEIEDIIQIWQYDVREVQHSGLRKIILQILNAIGSYIEYLSDEYLRSIPDRGVLFFRNESSEECDRLQNVLRPKTYELRLQISELYRKLFSIPGNDDVISNAVDDV